jgi:hypothetical protein
MAVRMRVTSLTVLSAQPRQALAFGLEALAAKFVVAFRERIENFVAAYSRFTGASFMQQPFK